MARALGQKEIPKPLKGGFGNRSNSNFLGFGNT